MYSIKLLLPFFLFVILLSGCETNPPTDPGQTATGKVYVTSNIDSAEIFVDEVSTGSFTPDTIETSIGTKTITLKKAGYASASMEIEVGSGAVADLSIPLQQAAAKIYITSNIEGASIYIDDIPVDKITPDTVEVAPGLRTVMLEKLGYINATTQVDAVIDTVIEVNLIMEEAASKIVLLEDFANVSCDPCVVSNKIIEQLSNVTYGHAKLVVVKYPTNFPSPNDPFYLAAKNNCNDRMAYYNIITAPTLIVDGTLKPTATDSNKIKQNIDTKLLEEPAFHLSVRDSISGGKYFMKISLRALNTSIDLANLILHCIVTETDIEYETPPGGNGETKFYNVMRKMLPNSTGEALSGISLSEENNFEYSVNINDITVFNSAKLHTVVYIQDKSTKKVYQAASTF